MIRPLSRWLFVLGAILYVFGSADAYWQSRLQVAISGGGGNNFTLIANTSASDPASGGALTTSAINSSGSNCILVAVSQYSGATIGTLTDSKSNSPIGLVAQIGSSEAYLRIYHYDNPIVGSGHTFTYTNGSQIFGAIAVQAWSGCNASSPFDVQNGTTATAASLAPGSVTPTNPNSLVVAAVEASTGATGSFSVNGGFTITDNIPTVPNVEGLAFAYLKQTTAVPANPTFSWTNTVDSAAASAVFKP